MKKLSEGDLTINESIYDKQFAALNIDDLNKRDALFFGTDKPLPDTDTKTESKPSEAKNIIPIQKNKDGSLKYKNLADTTFAGKEASVLNVPSSVD